LYKKKLQLRVMTQWKPNPLYPFQNSQGILNGSLFFWNMYNHLLSAHCNFFTWSLLLTSSPLSSSEKQKSVWSESPISSKTTHKWPSGHKHRCDNHHKVVLSQFHLSLDSCLTNFYFIVSWARCHWNIQNLVVLHI